MTIKKVNFIRHPEDSSLDFESDWVKKDEPKSGVLNGLAYSKEEKDLITKK